MRKKFCTFLALVMVMVMTMAVAAAGSAGRSDYVFIQDLTEFRNKCTNILMPGVENAEDYSLVGNMDSTHEYTITAVVKPDGSKTNEFPSVVSIYFRLPDGVDAVNLSYYDFTIVQTPIGGSGEETDGTDIKTYSTEDGSITVHEEYGLCIQTQNIGRFVVTPDESPAIGPSWGELMVVLAGLEGNDEREHKGVLVKRSGNKITFQGEGSGRRMRSDVDLMAARYALPGSHFVFDNIELQKVNICPEAGDNWTVQLTESVTNRRGVSVDLAEGSRVHLINDTTIRDLNEHMNQREYPLAVYVPYGASFLLTGKGEIPSGYCQWFTSTLEDVYIEEKSARIDVFVKADSAEETVAKLNKVFSDIQMDKHQFPAGDLSASVRVCMVREKSDGDDGEIVYEGHPAASNLSELNAGRINLLLPGSHDRADFTLMVSIDEQNGDRVIAYDLSLADNVRKMPASISGGAYLYLPYPAGMDMQSAEQYVFTVKHYTAYAEETFSTRDGSIELTPYGLRMLIHSMSPFVLTWEDAPDMNALPDTGDSSRLGLWLALLAMVGAALLTFRRRTA